MATTVAANPYYDDPWLTQAASNISKIFVDQNPGQTAVHNAQAKYYGAETDALTRKATAQSKIGSIFARRNGQALAPEDFATITGAGIEGGIDPKMYQQGNVFYASNTGQPDSVIARAVVGTDKLIGKDEGVSLADRDSVAARDNAAAAQRASISAGPGYAAVAESKRNHDAEMTYKEKHAYDKPENVPEGTAVFFAPGDPRFAGQAPGNIPAPRVDKDRFVVSPKPDGSFSYEKAAPGVPAPTPSSEKDRFVESQDDAGKPIWRRVQDGIAGPPRRATADHFVTTPDTNSPTGFSLAPAGAGVPVAPPAGAAGRPPMTVNPNELAAIEQDALAGIGVADPANKFAVDPQFSSSEYGAKVPAARAAAADVFQKTRNAAQAQAAYVQALGVPANAKWSAPSLIGRAIGGSAQFNVPGAAGPTASPPAAPGAAMAVPPAPQRVVGKIYPTPRGPMTWTAEGWVPTPRMDNGTR